MEVMEHSGNSAISAGSVKVGRVVEFTTLIIGVQCCPGVHQAPPQGATPRETRSAFHINPSGSDATCVTVRLWSKIGEPW